MDDLIGKDAEDAVGGMFRGNVKFGGGTVEFQRLYGAIAEDDAVPADIATSVALRERIIGGGMERHEVEAELTIFVGGNCRRDAGAQI